MNASRNEITAQAPASPLAGSFRRPLQDLVQAWLRFWFTPADPIGLHGVRILAGLLFLSWLLPLAGHEADLFGTQGWLDVPAYRELAGLPQEQRPPLGWSLLYLFGSNAAALTAFYWLSVGVLILFTLGMWTRVTAPLTWLILASFTANPVIEYDADCLLRLLAFYLMVGYLLLGQWNAGLPWIERLLGSNDTWLFLGGKADARSAVSESVAANVALRLIQVHLAVVMVASALHKLQFGEWWAGVGLWYPLHPPARTTFEEVRRVVAYDTLYMSCLSLANYALIAWQLGFPLFAWRPRLRPVLIGGSLIGWVGASWLYELPLFGPAIFIGCLAFLSTTEWQYAVSRVARLPGLQGLAQWVPAPSSNMDARDSKHEATTTFAAARHR